MNLEYKNFHLEIVDDSNYTLNSRDNVNHYMFEYFGGEPYEDRVYPSSKHGIRIFKEDIGIASAIICETGGATTIHENATLVKADKLFLCCSDKVYALSLTDLKLLWRKRLDQATCFGIYHFQDYFIIHGELAITCIDYFGNEKWSFGARDIFVTQDGSEAFKIEGNIILLKDWEGNSYTLNKNGKEII